MGQPQPPPIVALPDLMQEQETEPTSAKALALVLEDQIPMLPLGRQGLQRMERRFRRKTLAFQPTWLDVSSVEEAAR
jgi:hypothetical protein